MVAMVALTPLITIQVLGLVGQYRSRQMEKAEGGMVPEMAGVPQTAFELLGDDEIIEL